MKIAIPADEKSLQSLVCPSFGRAPYYLYHDTESKESTFSVNSAVESQGGAGIKAAQFLVDQKADVLLTPRCGQNAALVLTAAEIKVYQSIGGTLQDNLEAFNQGKLAVLDEFHAGHHGHGHGGN